MIGPRYIRMVLFFYRKLIWMGGMKENGRSNEPVNFQTHIKGRGAIMKEPKVLRWVAYLLTFQTPPPTKAGL
jgi:hypothetical protein